VSRMNIEMWQRLCSGQYWTKTMLKRHLDHENRPEGNNRRKVIGLGSGGWAHESCT